MFGVQAQKDCQCKACVKLREVTLTMRVARGAGVLLCLVLVFGGTLLLGALFVWGIGSVVRLW